MKASGLPTDRLLPYSSLDFKSFIRKGLHGQSFGGYVNETPVIITRLNPFFATRTVRLSPFETTPFAELELFQYALQAVYSCFFDSLPLGTFPSMTTW